MPRTALYNLHGTGDQPHPHVTHLDDRYTLIAHGHPIIAWELADATEYDRDPSHDNADDLYTTREAALHAWHHLTSQEVPPCPGTSDATPAATSRTAPTAPSTGPSSTPTSPA